MLGELLSPEIQDLIKARDFGSLRSALSELLPSEVADVLQTLEAGAEAIVFRVLPRDRAAAVFELLPLSLQESLLRALGTAQVAGVLNAMSPDDRTALLEELPAEVVQRLLELLTPSERKIAQTLLGYPEQSIGRLMTPEYAAIRPSWTVGEVFEHLRKVGADKETLNMIYVIDDDGRLIDDIPLRRLVLADPESAVAQLMDYRYACLQAQEDQEVAIGEFKKHDYSTLPVVDSDGKLVGIITADDVLDVAEEEETEDMQKMAAVSTLEAPYLEVGLWTMVRKRGLWLSVLFLGELLTAAAMGRFEAHLAQVVTLAVFLPLIISSGGNSGSQAATLVIRAMALGEVTLKDWGRTLRRELSCGLLLGVLLGALGLLRVTIWQVAGWKDFAGHYVLITITVAGTLLAIVALGALLGSMLPFVLRLLRLDPATVSAPLVATLVDVSGVLIYFGIASAIMHAAITQ